MMTPPIQLRCCYYPMGVLESDMVIIESTLPKKQNITKVRALVDIFIPKSLIPIELQNHIQSCEQEIATLKRNMKNIDHLLKAQPLSNESLVIERKLLKTAYNKQVQKLNDRLLEEATKLQLIPIKL